MITKWFKHVEYVKTHEFIKDTEREIERSPSQTPSKKTSHLIPFEVNKTSTPYFDN